MLRGNDINFFTANLLFDQLVVCNGIQNGKTPDFAVMQSKYIFHMGVQKENERSYLEIDNWLGEK